MEIGNPRKTITIEPLVLPVPEKRPAEPPAPVKAPDKTEVPA